MYIIYVTQGKSAKSYTSRMSGYRSLNCASAVAHTGSVYISRRLYTLYNSVYLPSIIISFNLIYRDLHTHVTSRARARALSRSPPRETLYMIRNSRHDFARKKPRLIVHFWAAARTYIYLRLFLYENVWLTMTSVTFAWAEAARSYSRERQMCSRLLYSENDGYIIYFAM